MIPTTHDELIEKSIVHNLFPLAINHLENMGYKIIGFVPGIRTPFETNSNDKYYPIDGYNLIIEKPNKDTFELTISGINLTTLKPIFDLQ